ncbi:hypothetical protein HIM_10384 [Hirsutella minnesotensis 3608]|uniref:AB hydrolase-1 domain-containing protein n=1 Tax=Hirsutella minnesotensis 3608 TaxID=1043627 RepID=A0A0F7ZG42_9HYPO|nr:hypothetical protein HIM_10384 [Hirsutella minnesotensis 3608]
MAARSDYIDDPRFNRTFQLPLDAGNGRASPFKVQYADYGYRNEACPEEENVFLFFGPLMASRLIHIAKDDIAVRHKVRIINLDRPGIGGTDACTASERMSLWLKVVPALLDHLKIRSVSLGCHSGGLIYALDILLHHPEILHPERPYLAIGGPWISPSHTSSTTFSLVQVLPVSIVSNFDKLARLINNHVGPILGVSYGLAQTLLAKFTSPPQQVKTEGTVREGAEFEDQLRPKVIERIYAEGIQGISADAVVLMKKGDGLTGWSDWGDYDTFVPRLAESLRASGKKLSVDVFYAEHDFVIGDAGSRGPLWFDECWNVPRRSDILDYHSMTVKGADHNGIWDLRWGAMQTVFERIATLAMEE